MDDLHVSRGSSPVLRGVSLDAPLDQITVVLGRNGAGKSTLINTIMGTLPKPIGSIRLDGTGVDRLPAWKRSRAGLAIVPQGRRVFADLTVEETLDIVSRGEEFDLDEIYGLFAGLERRRKVRAGNLSGGEQQMLAIARALATSPRMLLLDEPSEGLAPHVVAQLADFVRTLSDRGIGVLLAEQNLVMALSVADRVHILHEGRIAYDGSPIDLAERADIQTALLGV